MSIKELCPPLLFRLLRACSSNSIRYTGRYQAWSDAAAQATGYADGSILEKVAQATREVESARARYEQDSVLFEKMAHPFHLLAVMLRSAIEQGGRLHVVDYGGALGSLYRRCRAFLPPLDLQWSVVEQANFVAAGKRGFENHELRFYERPSEIPPEPRPNVLLFSSVVQYLEHPFVALNDGAWRSAGYLLLDRLPVTDGSRDVLCVQRVPARIYKASYPVRIFGRERLLTELQKDWLLIEEFDAPEGSVLSSSGISFSYQNFIFQRRLNA